jgi:cation diffusion facilitator CzcD-associated flavoprotein CzcO
MYRFHPSIKWRKGYPDRQQIVSQVKELWLRYGLDKHTTFNTKVTKIYQDKKKRWIINDPSNGRFDGVLVAVGTCAEPKSPHIPGMDKFKGKIYHSSELDGKKAEGNNVVIIGGGASAVEALEFVAHENAAMTSILARVNPSLQ